MFIVCHFQHPGWLCLQECQVLSVNAMGQVVDKINVHPSVESSGYIVKVTILPHSEKINKRSSFFGRLFGCQVPRLNWLLQPTHLCRCMTLVEMPSVLCTTSLYCLERSRMSL